ncbi:MAG: CPBP family intramembrane metalloprotease [Phycisphaerae bacterium]|nr:CPBP family intramembrane metalloprotease [Phycisphaerae bacterium]
MNTCIAASDPTATVLAGMSINVGEILVVTVIFMSVVTLAAWFVFYSGPAALAAAPLRRNRVPLYLPFLLLLAWVLGTGAMLWIMLKLFDPAGIRQELLTYVAAALVEALLAIFIIAIAAFLFQRGLKGFGLDVRTLSRDLRASVANLVAVLPLVWFGVWAVDVIGKWIVGPTFEIRTSEGLDVLTRSAHVSMRLLMLAFVVIIVPVFEEVLFRGMLQSTIRGYVRSPWVAVVITSILFAAMHPWHHWPAIFMLSLGMGYAYERSGSLFRPIFIHIIFNTSNVVAALLAS